MIERTKYFVLEDSMEEAAEIPPRKMKKTRRGKKKRSKSFVGDPDDGFVDIADSEFMTPYEIPNESKVKRERIKGKPRSLRPIEVPKAPKNSTQFIIDDHEDSNLYISFERRILSGSVEDAEHMFAGFQDIDYEYESPDDLDTNAFYARDFENIYRRFKEEELMSLPRKAIMEQYLELEQRVLDLENRVSDRDPGVVIAKLQEELLSLQEENSMLKKRKLTLSCKALSLSEKEDLDSSGSTGTSSGKEEESDPKSNSETMNESSDPSDDTKDMIMDSVDSESSE